MALTVCYCGGCIIRTYGMLTKSIIEHYCEVAIVGQRCDKWKHKSENC